MRNIAFILLTVITVCFVSCSQYSSHNRNTLDEAEKMMLTEADSAVAMLDAIDPSELRVDSLRAGYHYLRAFGHMRQNRSMIGDSLIGFAHNYYKDKTDKAKDMRSGVALAWYKFWVGDTPGAIGLLDSLSSRKDVPDRLLAEALRVRVLLGASEYQGRTLIGPAKRLLQLETDSLRRLEATYMLLSAYEYAGEPDSALMLTDKLIEHASKNRLGERHFIYMMERAQILGEMGRTRESDEAVDYLFDHAGTDNGAADLLHLQKAMNALNAGQTERAAKELTVADSFAAHLRDDDTYFRSYSNLLHAMIDFKQTGRMKLAHVNGIYNRQRERYNRIKASQWESERGALQQQSRAMSLKAESEHKTVVMLVIVLVAVVLLSCAAWIIRHRRQRERENEERTEALQKMVDELSAAEQAPATLRRAMLQQLGIIKMVAETPTEQNREMLRKISSIDGEPAGGELVNWETVFEVVDNLHAGFHRKLRERFGDVLSAKEEQITVMMAAGFSTKEISVITGQTTSTIYVRKSAIRKKLGVPEKEDIVAFLRNEFGG